MKLMKQYWETLYLDGYLEYGPHPQGYTFSRTFPETPELPKLTVGLGVLTRSSSSGYRVYSIPFHMSGIREDTFIDIVEEKQEQLRHLPNWRELLLLDLGYTTDLLLLSGREREGARLHCIPEGARTYLLKKHGLHKLATTAAYGYGSEADMIIDIINEYGHGQNYGDLLRVMVLGVVPMEDLHLAAQLPTEMVKGIYSPSSGGK